ncbi:hypothetical protein D3C71_2164300 [compost metagenome]
MPGQANTVSTSTEPPRIWPACSDTKVMTGKMALRRMWRRQMRDSGTPLACAVFTKSWSITSMAAARVTRV